MVVKKVLRSPSVVCECYTGVTIVLIILCGCYAVPRWGLCGCHAVLR
jgi:hypothetical protein